MEKSKQLKSLERKWLALFKEVYMKEKVNITDYANVITKDK